MFDDDDFAKMDFHPWEVLRDPKRAAKALARLLHTTVLADADASKRASDEAVLRAMASAESRPSLQRALEPLGFDDAETAAFFSSRGAECFAQATAEVLLQPRQPIVIRGALGALPVPRLIRENEDFETLKRERIIDVLTEKHAELDGTSATYALVYDGHQWYRAHTGAIDGAGFILDRDLKFPKRDVQAASAELFAGFEGGFYRWSDLEGGPVIVSGGSYRTRAQVLDRVIDAAVAGGCAARSYVKPGTEPLRNDASRTAEDFEAALVSVATDRLVEGQTDRHLVIAVADLESLTKKVEESPYPAPTLPTVLRNKIQERVVREQAHNDRIDAILSLIDTLIRQSTDLNLTVIIATSASGERDGRAGMTLGGTAPWARASTIRLWNDDDALRGSVRTPTSGENVQFYV
ncbi:hypothetical protein ACWGJ9_09510 [Curtobacterium citreum]